MDECVEDDVDDVVVVVDVVAVVAAASLASDGMKDLLYSSRSWKA